jgi:multidrug transporter EmrE-like cation transporter
MRPWMYLVVTMFIPVIAQILIKIGLQKVGNLDLSNPARIVHALLSPWVVGGLACYAVGAILLITVLSRYEMGYANLILSFGYVILLAASILIFHEKTSLSKALGAGLIIAGIILVGRA